MRQNGDWFETALRELLALPVAARRRLERVDGPWWAPGVNETMYADDDTALDPGCDWPNGSWWDIVDYLGRHDAGTPVLPVDPMLIMQAAHDRLRDGYRVQPLFMNLCYTTTMPRTDRYYTVTSYKSGDRSTWGPSSVGPTPHVATLRLLGQLYGRGRWRPRMVS